MSDTPEIVWVNECDHTQCVTEYAVTGIPYRRDDLFVEMEAQRDELLAALGIIAGNPFLNSDTMQFALAAIAKCEAKP